MKKIKVLIVDDSPVVRGVLSNTLNRDQEITVVGTARDPYQAVEQIKKLQPDLLTLDVEMPGMNGLEFLKRLMISHPLPVIMVSSLTTAHSKVTVQALGLGALDYIAKPVFANRSERISFKAELIRKVKAVRLVNRDRLRMGTGKQPAKRSLPGNEGSRGMVNKGNKEGDLVIGIGASTGGVRAVKEVITHFPEESPGLIIIQHMPVTFTGPFAQMLDEASALKIKEAEEGDWIVPGQALVVPGDLHLELVKQEGAYCVRLKRGKKVNYQRPSIDVTFNSMAEQLAEKAVGIILTGMGSDGARGLKRMKQAGAYTLAQDRDSSVIYGMPGEAIRIGAVTEVAPLNKIVAKVLKQIREERD